MEPQWSAKATRWAARTRSESVGATGRNVTPAIRGGRGGSSVPVECIVGCGAVECGTMGGAGAVEVRAGAVVPPDAEAGVATAGTGRVSTLKQRTIWYPPDRKSTRLNSRQV